MVREKVAKLSSACQSRGVNLEILPGGAIQVQPWLLKAFYAGEVLTVGDCGKFLLLELPRRESPEIDELVSGLLARGVTPILAHPERNHELADNPRLLAEFIKQGCIAQITGAALLGYFGEEAMNAARMFLGMGLVHVVASVLSRKYLA
jgi:protein-tyrosine phosphatase